VSDRKYDKAFKKRTREIKNTKIFILVHVSSRATFNHLLTSKEFPL